LRGRDMFLPVRVDGVLRAVRFYRMRHGAVFSDRPVQLRPLQHPVSEIRTDLSGGAVRLGSRRKHRRGAVVLSVRDGFVRSVRGRGRKRHLAAELPRQRSGSDRLRGERRELLHEPRGARGDVFADERSRR
jgi:hypothetical protein